MYKEKFEELKHSGKLPSPSSVGMRILVLTQDDECSLDDVVDTIQVDPALTGRVIKVASSVQQGGHMVTTVKDAALRIGLRAVCSTALGFTVVSGNRRGRCSGFDYEKFWSTSLATAVSAELIASRLRLGSASDAFTFGLLLEIGRLALASVHPQEYAALLADTATRSPQNLAVAERERFLITHREVTAALMEEWGLPAHFSEVAVRFDGRSFTGDFDHPQTAGMLKVLNAASIMATVCVSDKERQPHLWPGLRRLCQALDVESKQICDLFDEVVKGWTDWGRMLEVSTPVALSGAEIERRAQGLAKPGKEGLRILAVDDDPVSLRLLTSLLRRDGHEVLTARDGKEALAIYLEKGAQVVITDWMMPEMDGLMLCRQLRKTEEGRKLYILLLTGRTEEERIVEAFEVGVDDYIVKPFKPELLKARIQPARRVIRLQEDNDLQVHEKERLNRQLDIEKRKFKAAAMTDALTDLPNRRHAMDRLEKQWANSRRASETFAVVTLDIDHFKRVNDTWGHDVGDVVLQSTARAVQSALRRGDMCARMGGEEFLVICPNTSTEEGALRVAERIRETIEQNQIVSGEFEGHVTASLGVALASPRMPSMDALLKAADEAVYAAKKAGRNQVALWPDPPDSGRRSA